MLTVTGPIPRWASAQPSRCRARGRCVWRPSARHFGRFMTAVARRYRNRVRLWSIWNEPNLGGRLAPQVERVGGVRVYTAGKLYRALWLAGWRAINRHDRPRRNSVLFGETAPVGSPVVLLRAALCLDPRGRPFKGRARTLQGCGRPARLPVRGFSHHPYTPGAVGSIRRTFSRGGSITITYTPRLHRLIDGAARQRRIPRGAGVWMTEFGFQTNPPDDLGLTPNEQALALNEADRLFAADRRVKSVAQYLLIDDADTHVFNSGLRYSDGTAKPSFTAYRLPIVVTRVRGNPDAVDIWGWARGARSEQGVVITTEDGSVTGVTVTNRYGQLRTRVEMLGAAARRYRLEFVDPVRGTFRSRLAAPGDALRYRRN
jgi:hypothetical protein